MCTCIYAYITPLITKDKTYFKQEVSTSGNIPQCLKMSMKSSAWLIISTDTYLQMNSWEYRPWLWLWQASALTCSNIQIRNQLPDLSILDTPICRGFCSWRHESSVSCLSVGSCSVSRKRSQWVRVRWYFPWQADTQDSKHSTGAAICRLLILMRCLNSVRILNDTVYNSAKTNQRVWGAGNLWLKERP